MSSFYNNPNAEIVSITHSGGILTLNHKRGSFFEVTATGNITAIQHINSSFGTNCLIRITASGGERTVNFGSTSADPRLLSITSLADGEFVLAQGVDLPDL